tara:strand:- start:1107 stop:1400 length:294 start_codon:yes stop_codon:yes gene_type:complete
MLDNAQNIRTIQRRNTIDDSKESDMKTKMIFAAVMASMFAAGSVYAMDSDTLQKRMQEIEERSTEASEEQKVEALEQEVAELKDLLQMTVESLEESQ